MSRPSFGTVKAITSGDTIQIMGPPRPNGPPMEKQLTLACVMAPRLARKETPDEPWAYQAREFLRKKVIGKQIKFQLEGKNPAGREFAAVWTQDETNLSVALVAAGLAKAKTVSENNQPSWYGDLMAAEEEATAAELGIWTKDVTKSNATVRQLLLPEVNFQPAQLLREIENVPTPAIVEYVRDGHSLRVVIPKTSHFFFVQLSGAQCASMKAQENGNPAPFAREAKFYTECQTLHRDVVLKLEGVDKYGNFFGAINTEKGSLGEQLLGLGLAKLNNFSAAFSSSAATLRAAEQHAREQKLRLWHDYVKEASGLVTPSASERDYHGVVVEVVSGDILVVAHQKTGVEQRLNLSNVRAPRMATPNNKAQPYGWEAREALRKKVIGKKVRVYIDFVKPPLEGQNNTKTSATVYTEKGVNLSEFLVKQGLATVFKLRSDSDERSMAYDTLLAAEAKAKQANQGVHKEGAAPVNHFNDVSNPAKAKQFLPFLQRASHLTGIVEYVMNAGRVKVTVPKEGCTLLLNLAGIRAPVAPGKGREGQPMGAEAAAFTRRMIMSRNVDLDVRDVDRAGIFIGSVHIDGANMSLLLVQNGLAKTSYADRLPFADALYEAEEEAKNARLGIWKDYDPAAEAAAAAAAAGEDESYGDAAPDKTAALNVVVTEIVDAEKFYVQVNDGKSPSVEDRIKAATVLTGSPVTDVRKGQIVAAQFTADDGWYRAKITDVLDGGKTVAVHYLDYGNAETLSVSRLQGLESGSMSKLSAQAVECQMAYIRPASVEEDEFLNQEAAHFLRKLVWGKNLAATVERRAKDGIAQAVMLHDDALSINNALVRAGLYKLTRIGRLAPHIAEKVNRLREDQAIAKDARLHLWQYGDVGSDEDAPEFGYVTRRA